MLIYCYNGKFDIILINFERFLLENFKMGKNEITLFCVNDGKNHKIENGRDLKALSDKYCSSVTDKKTGQNSMCWPRWWTTS